MKQGFIVHLCRFATSRDLLSAYRNSAIKRHEVCFGDFCAPRHSKFFNRRQNDRELHLSDLEVLVKSDEALTSLRNELDLLHRGNHSGQSTSSYFVDSEICCRSPFYSCRSSRCVLMRFVPERFRSEAVPCHYIPLNESGQTLEMLYQKGITKEELGASVRTWLHSTIGALESLPSEERRVA